VDPLPKHPFSVFHCFAWFCEVLRRNFGVIHSNMDIQTLGGCWPVHERSLEWRMIEWYFVLKFFSSFFNFYVCSSFPSQKVYFVRWIPPTCCILLNATRVTWFPPIIHLHNLIFAVRFVHSSPILFYSFTSCSDLILATWSSIGEMFCLLDLQYLSTISLMSNFIPVSSRFCSNPVPNMSLHSPSSVAFPS